VAVQIILDDRGSVAARRWRARRATAGLPLLAFFAISTIRLGAIDHSWPSAIAINALLLASLPIVVRLLRRMDAEASPPGALFSAGCSLGVRQLDQPRFQDVAKALGSGLWGTGYVSGPLTLTADEIRVVPASAPQSGTLVVRAADVESAQLTKLPAKFNVAGLDLTFVDGSRLSIEVRQYDRLRSALTRFGQDGASANRGTL
jgi:hypothetical protein